MNKFFLLFLAVFCAAFGDAAMAITVKKAAPVATKQAAATESAGSLVGTVMGLVSGVQQMSQKQKELTDECIPTSQELTFVNNTIKEWAKTGAMSAEEVETSLKGRMRRCTNSATGGYAATVSIAAGTNDDEMICYDWFGSESDKEMIWYQYPMATKATYCSDGSLSCSEKNKKTVSNIYDIFNLVDFSEADYYTANEISMAAKLMDKIENCSYAKLNAKKKAMWGEFLVQTIGNAGQKTNTGAIMQAVGSTSNNGIQGALQSLGGMASQFMDR